MIHFETLAVSQAHLHFLVTQGGLNVRQKTTWWQEKRPL